MSVSYKIVARANNIYELGIIRSLLETNDIPTFVTDEYVSQTLPMLSMGNGGVRLMVNELDYDKAMSLLLENNLLEHTEIEPEITDEQIRNSLKHESTDHSKSNVLIYLIVLFVLFLVLVFLLLLGLI